MDIYNYLDEGEKIIYSGNANPKKVSKQTLRLLLILAFLILMIFLLYTDIKNNTVNFANTAILITTILFSIILIYAYIYNTIIITKKHKNDIYYITNKKIYIFNKNTNPIIENINNFIGINISKEKNNYGNLIFFKEMEGINNDDPRNILFSLPKMLKNNSKICIPLVGVVNPREVVQSIISIYENIIISDDRPEFLGKKLKIK